VQAMLTHGATVEAGDLDGYTPLMWAALLHRPKTARLLLDHGANVNAQYRGGVTPLIYATMLSASPDLVRLLLDHGADVNQRFISPMSMGSGLGGWPHAVKLQTTPLLWAAGCQQWGIVKVLLTYNVDVNAKDVDLNAMDGYGESALMDAVRYAQPDVVEALIRRGADMHTRDRSGQTLLMATVQEAIECNFIPSTKEKMEQIRNTAACLIRYGASVDDKDQFGNTALSLARQIRKDQQLVQVLQQAGAKE
jgi:ankyrin repeat protein